MDLQRYYLNGKSEPFDIQGIHYLSAILFTDVLRFIFSLFFPSIQHLGNYGIKMDCEMLYGKIRETCG